MDHTGRRAGSVSRSPMTLGCSALIPDGHEQADHRTGAARRLLRLPGAAVIDVSFSVRRDDRDRLPAPPAKGVLARWPNRPAPARAPAPRQARAPPRPRREPLLYRVLSAAPLVPGLRCAVRGGPAHYAHDFEDVTAWLAQQVAKTPIAGLLRIAWDTVGRIVERVVADHLDERRLNGLVAIGSDEINYRRGQRYLTSVVDHRAGAIVWCAPGRKRPDLAGARHRARRALEDDPRGLDRHVGRLRKRDARARARRDLLRPAPRRALGAARRRPGPPRRRARLRFAGLSLAGGDL